MKFAHSLFLIVGTSVGAGILALPLSTASCGFWGSLVALVITGAFMTYAALNMLRARLYFAQGADLDTMSLGLLGARAAWILRICYLCLLFALVSMYITVGANWIVELSHKHLGMLVPQATAQIIFTAVVASIIYSGLGNLAQVNQWITGAKVLFLLLIICVSLPEIKPHNLTAFEPREVPATFSMLLTTFGFSIILPSLATYMEGNKRKLTLALGLGSLIIVLIYALWELVCFGVIGAGTQGLEGIAKLQDKGTGVINALTHLVSTPAIQTFGFGIMLTAVVTSFLGVGQCLFSYVMDSLPAHAPRRAPLAILLGFIPPLLLIQLYPAGITQLLSLAGIFVAIVLGVFPNVMVLSRPYRKGQSALKRLDVSACAVSLVFFSGCVGYQIWELLKNGL
ncbi:MAG: hypothetical protein C0514_00625 [Candidatus Puniceispirillum sp.]|nr:hypothetical protein [Candidatus Puniceispirillum sp.]